MKFVNNIWIFVNIAIIMRFRVKCFFDNLHYCKTNLVTNPPTLYMISPQQNHLQNKKILSISPGGYKGFYVLGICKYIKENYCLRDYVFSGASAGAWNSLMLCSHIDIPKIQKKILDKSFSKIDSIYELENQIKHKFLDNYKTRDFDLSRLYVGVTTLHNYKSNIIIYNGFENLEDALNCCIASSHIPFLTGGLTNVYRKTLSFDGGFSPYPYLNTSETALHIYPNIWNHFSTNKSVFNLSDYTTLLSKSKFPFEEMIENGYLDTKQNAKQLDIIFKNK